jgi:glycine/D-amino acid oxidase-like deaminating enzyme
MIPDFLNKGGHTKTATYRSFHENVKSVGAKDAVKITNLEYNTMVSVHAFAKQHAIPCDSVRCQTIDVFYDQAQYSAGKDSVALMEELMGIDKAPRHIFHSVEETSKKYLAPGSVGSLEYESGSLSAYKFTIGVLKLALEKGLNLQCNTPATSISKSDNANWHISTPRGTITSKKLVLATNGYTAHLYPRLQGVIVPLRGVVTAQRPGQNLPQTGLDTTYSFVYKEGFEYMISRPPGSKFQGDIVIGGGMHVAKDDGMNEYGNTDDTTYDTSSAKYLLACTRRYFGKNWGEDHREGHNRRTWSGVMGFSADGYPFVGPVPKEEGLFLSASFQGHGMVLCFLCARAVTTMIEGKDGDELSSWFPDCYRVTDERMGKKFEGRLRASGAPEPTANGAK